MVNGSCSESDVVGAWFAEVSIDSKRGAILTSVVVEKLLERIETQKSGQ